MPTREELLKMGGVPASQFQAQTQTPQQLGQKLTKEMLLARGGKVPVPPPPPPEPSFASKAGGVLLGGLKGLANIGEAGLKFGVKAVPAVASAIASPFTRTAATIASGANAALNPKNALTEEQSAQRSPLLRPYGTVPEAIGGALQIGATLLPGTSTIGGLATGAAKAAIPAAVTQGTIGGTMGLVHGLGSGLQEVGQKKLTGQEAVNTVTTSGISSGLTGIGAGIVTGGATDVWKGNNPLTGSAWERNSAVTDKISATDNLVKKVAGEQNPAYEGPGGKNVTQKPFDSAAVPSAKQAADKMYRAGYEPKHVSFIADSDKPTAEAYNAMVNEAEAGSKNLHLRAAGQRDVLGDIISEKAKTVSATAKSTGQQIGELMKTEGAKPVTVDLSSVGKRLIEDGVKITPKGLDFSASVYRNNSSAQKLVETAFNETSNANSLSAAQIAKQSIDDIQPNALGGLSTVEKKANAFAEMSRKAIGKGMTDVSKPYEQLAQRFAERMDVLDSLYKLMGSKYNDMSPEFQSVKNGAIALRQLGNASAEASSVLSALDNMAGASGYKGPQSSYDLAVFTKMVEDAWGNTPVQALQKQTQAGAAEAMKGLANLATPPQLKGAAAAIKMFGGLFGKTGNKAAQDALKNIVQTVLKAR